MAQSPNCTICGELLDDTRKGDVIQIGQKGCTGLQNAARLRGDSLQFETGQFIHVSCRRDYTDSRRISLFQQKCNDVSHSESITKNLRTKNEVFDFKLHCFYCGRKIDDSSKPRKRRFGDKEDKSEVMTIEYKERILQRCSKRQDAWGKAVQSKLLSVNDLVAVEASYHRSCDTHFRLGRKPPDTVDVEFLTPTKKRLGQPVSATVMSAFNEVIKFIEENESDQVSMQDLINVMAKNLPQGTEAYTAKHMKKMLSEHFGDAILIIQQRGKETVVTLKQTADAILREFHGMQISDPDHEKNNILQTAAKLILSGIKSVKTNPNEFPSVDIIRSPSENMKYLPESLSSFLLAIITNKSSEKSVAYLGQCIMQSARPRSLLAPLLLGLGVELHTRYASRHLIDILHSLGGCCSYAEVTSFDSNAAAVHGTDIPGFSGNAESVQYVADNVDHNSCTIDAYNTFHGMGILASVTKGTFSSQRVPRMKVDTQDILRASRIPIHYHEAVGEIVSSIKYNPLISVEAIDPTENFDIIWRTSVLFRPRRPNWSGMMQVLHHGEHPGKASFVFLPMIDMDPNNPTCIFNPVVCM